VPVTKALHETPSSLITRINTKTPAPNTTGVVFKLYRPNSEKPAASSDSSNYIKTKVILGVILGPICLGVVVLMLIAMWRGRGRAHGKQSKAEEGKYLHREHRSKDDMINEAHRRRRERNRRGRERDLELNTVTHADLTDAQVSPMRSNLPRAHLPDDCGYDVSPLSLPTGLWGHVQPR
jgi:hypothetical protein